MTHDMDEQGAQDTSSGALRLGNIRQALEAALTPTLSTTPNNAEEITRTMLNDQAQVLDALFRLSLSRAVGTQPFHKSPRPDYYNDERVQLALRAQQQCHSTLKAIHSIDYMKSLSPDKPATIPDDRLDTAHRGGVADDHQINKHTPTPVTDDKRTEEL